MSYLHNGRRPRNRRTTVLPSLKCEYTKIKVSCGRAFWFPQEKTKYCNMNTTVHASRKMRDILYLVRYLCMVLPKLKQVLHCSWRLCPCCLNQCCECTASGSVVAVRFKTTGGADVCFDCRKYTCASFF